MTLSAARFDDERELRQTEPIKGVDKRAAADPMLCMMCKPDTDLAGTDLPATTMPVDRLPMWLFSALLDSVGILLPQSSACEVLASCPAWLVSAKLELSIVVGKRQEAGREAETPVCAHAWADALDSVLDPLLKFP